jgi:predicted alpha/beta-hydrolase family hydrolase
VFRPRFSAAGKPSDDRAQHLNEVQIPMLFLQGSRDALADLRYLYPLIDRLGQGATLKVFEDADHSFHVRKSSGRNDSEIRAEMLDALAHWIAGVTEC